VNGAGNSVRARTSYLSVTTFYHGSARTNDTAAEGVGRYVGLTPMWERTICGFRAGETWGAQRACFVGGAKVADWRRNLDKYTNGWWQWRLIMGNTTQYPFNASVININIVTKITGYFPSSRLHWPRAANHCTPPARHRR